MEFNKDIAQQISSAMADAMLEGAQDIAEESQRQVPVKSGALKKDCQVIMHGDLSVTVEYDLPYAVKVHEDMGAKHAEGKAKFLEDPFNQKAENVVLAAAENIKRVIE